MTNHAVRPSPPGISEAEWTARLNLAALYRLFHHFGWADLTYTHLSSRVPGAQNHYLINPYGFLFDEIDASSLVVVDFDGRTISGSHRYNRAGHVVHSSVLAARPEINYVLHSHTRAGAAVSAMRCGLLPISQPALAVRSTVSYHRYGAVSEDSEKEGAEVAADLGGNYAMILQNHGLLVCGRTPGEAFLYHYFLQSACEIQVDVIRTGADYVTPSDEAIREIGAWSAPREKPWGATQWDALVRFLARTDPSYAR